MIYVVDELTLRPGMLEPFKRALAARYRPGAEARGLKLIHTWLTPPLELEEGSNQLILVWTLDGPEGFWGMRARSGSDPDLVAWWRETDRYLTGRRRRYLTETELPPGPTDGGH